ncbi:MAG: isopentenyl-diphosphate delta-isomerase [Candidatus Symbiothrix sp.]|jgi:isopentenyl-diphosphate delta-isomerase|nr:isopentenyl-diphosphate delta-isomerase [Candidatus Symbiothrix sp.]
MVLLVNGEQYDKLKAHKEGKFHYAFSVFVFNAKNELLLQQRAAHKYHSGGLWTNTCCSHPLSDAISEIKKFAEERLVYEMGISCSLEHAFDFEYNAQCGDLTENEYDCVFIGCSDETPHVNSNEVNAYQWDSLENINKRRIIYSQEYTPWFNIILDKCYAQLLNRLNKATEVN